MIAFPPLPLILDLILNAAYPILIISGIICVLSIFRWRRRGEDLKPSLVLMTFIGFILGVLCIIIGAIFWSRGEAAVFTVLLYILSGLALCLGPIREFPLAGISSVIVGSIVAFYVSGFIHSTWIIALVFVVITIIVFIIAGFFKSILDIVGAILNFPIVISIIGVLCIAQGFLLMLGMSLI
ncbi:MAG: hypothetical protein ACTSSJ_00280 [Candidatus Odinarchaeia archaeon]